MPSETQAIHEGRFSDGQTAGTLPAALRLTPQGVEIAPRGAGKTALTWPYDGLAASPAIRADMSDVLLSHAATPGATLFVADRNFIAVLAGRAPHLSLSSQRWRVARPLMIAGAAIILAGIALWVADVSPARGLAGLLPAEVRQSLGQQVVRSFGRGTCHTPEGSAALARLTERLSAATGGKRFSVSVLDWGIVNAFAAPGEQIVLARALIERAKSPEEVAGILAHEMGHGLELHPEAGLIRALGIGAAVTLLFGGSDRLANLGALLTQLAYTRAAEREADAHALRILEKALISPKGIAEFFARLDRREGPLVGDDISIFRTHPLSEERARLAASRPAYPTTPALSEAEWRALQSICRR
jgi:beta-barrel assembly-enhancing protease